jgi:hypothetical protein
MTQGQVMCYRIANEPILAILLAMATFVLVVDALIMNVSVSDSQLVSAGDPAKTKYVMASGRDCPIGHHPGGSTVTNHPLWVRSDPT